MTSVYDAAGGDAAFQRLAAAHHARCLADPLLEHPFSHGGHPDHVERLGRYWAEAFGGPAWYSEQAGGQTAMLSVHAGQGIDPEYAGAFVACFVAAADDAGLPTDPDLRRVLREYMTWAVTTVEAVAPEETVVPDGLAVPRWDWNGLVDA